MSLKLSTIIHLPSTLPLFSSTPTLTPLHRISSPHSPDPLDPLTATTHLRSALSQFLGLTGAAIPIDILKCGSDQPSSTPLSAPIHPAPSNDDLPSIASQAENQRKSEVWIRVPREDGDAVAAALGSSWVGRDGGRDVSWRVRGRGEWLGALVGEDRGKSLWD
jgi:ribonuclease P/MRP protein subunit POP8